MIGYDDIHSQCFKDTVSAYQKGPTGRLSPHTRIHGRVRRYKRHEGEADDASRQVQDYIAFTASLNPKKYRVGVSNERRITNR